jgi:hypothetical protein
MILSPLKINGPKALQTGPEGMVVPDLKARVSNFLKRREQGWQQYVLPISSLNEQWHPSQKITFEKI